MLFRSMQQISDEEKIPLQDLEDIVTLIHEFDPPGVGARDLKECLLIQAKHLEEDTQDLVYLINNHIKDLLKIECLQTKTFAIAENCIAEMQLYSGKELTKSPGAPSKTQMLMTT